VGSVVIYKVIDAWKSNSKFLVYLYHMLCFWELVLQNRIKNNAGDRNYIKTTAGLGIQTLVGYQLGPQGSVGVLHVELGSVCYSLALSEIRTSVFLGALGKCY